MFISNGSPSSLYIIEKLSISIVENPFEHLRQTFIYLTFWFVFDENIWKFVDKFIKSFLKSKPQSKFLSSHFVIGHKVCCELFIISFTELMTILFSPYLTYFPLIYDFERVFEQIDFGWIMMLKSLLNIIYG